jgi:hypothetical protein
MIRASHGVELQVPPAVVKTAARVRAIGMS